MAERQRRPVWFAPACRPFRLLPILMVPSTDSFGDVHHLRTARQRISLTDQHAFAEAHHLHCTTCNPPTNPLNLSLTTRPHHLGALHLPATTCPPFTFCVALVAVISFLYRAHLRRPASWRTAGAKDDDRLSQVASLNLTLPDSGARTPCSHCCLKNSCACSGQSLRRREEKKAPGENLLLLVAGLSLEGWEIL